MSTFSAYSDEMADNCCLICQVCTICPSNSDGNMPKGSALPDMYRLLSIQVCSRGIWTLLFPHTLARPGTDTAERLSLRHNNTLGRDKEIASLRRQMLVQLLSGQSRGLSVYYQEAPFALFCFVAATIKAPVDSLWSKSFHLLFKEKMMDRPYIPLESIALSPIGTSQSLLGGRFCMSTQWDVTWYQRGQQPFETAL